MENNAHLRFMDEQIKVSFTNISFTVNKKKKWVTCRLNYVVKLPNMVDEIEVPYEVYKNVPFYAGRGVHTSYGTARVCDGDTFDIEVGKKVARAKAESAAYKNVRKMLYNTMQHIAFTRLIMEDFLNKCDRVIVHNAEYLRKF